MDVANLPARLAAREARGRAMALARMTSRCRNLRRTGRQPQDESTGEQSPEWLVIHVDLPIRLDGGSSSDGGSRTVSMDGFSFEEATGIAHLPASTTDLADGDYIDVTAGEWPGFVCSVVKALRADQKTARRVPIREESRPDEWGF